MRLLALALALAALPAHADDLQLELRETRSAPEGKQRTEVTWSVRVPLVLDANLDSSDQEDISVIDVQRRGDQLLQTVRTKRVGHTLRAQWRRTKDKAPTLDVQLILSRVVGKAPNLVDPKVINPVLANLSQRFRLPTTRGLLRRVVKTEHKRADGTTVTVELYARILPPKEGQSN